MSYYIKKCWKENTLTIFCLVLLCSLQVGANMLMMQSFQGIIDRNMNRFLAWTVLLVVFHLRIDRYGDFFPVPCDSSHEQCHPAGYGRGAACKELSAVS